MCYARARFCDAGNRRFTAVDPILAPSQYDPREYVTALKHMAPYDLGFQFNPSIEGKQNCRSI